jgi:hypothetical protein
MAASMEERAVRPSAAIVDRLTFLLGVSDGEHLLGPGPARP